MQSLKPRRDSKSYTSSFAHRDGVWHVRINGVQKPEPGEVFRVRRKDDSLVLVAIGRVVEELSFSENSTTYLCSIAESEVISSNPPPSFTWQGEFRFVKIVGSIRPRRGDVHDVHSPGGNSRVMIDSVVNTKASKVPGRSIYHCSYVTVPEGCTQCSRPFDDKYRRPFLKGVALFCGDCLGVRSEPEPPEPKKPRTSPRNVWEAWSTPSWDDVG